MEKSPKRHRRRGWVRAARTAGLMALSLALAAYLLLPGQAAQTQAYDSLRLFTEALYEISQKYVYPKSEEDMIYGALRGMMNSLDPDSSFLTAKEYLNYLQGQKGQPAEAGVELVFKDNLLTATSVIDDGPAARAGLKPGDHILKIEGHQVRYLTTQEAARRFVGNPGATVKLQVLRNGMIKPLDVTVTLEPLGGATVSHQFLDDAFAYVRVRYFNNETSRELSQTFKLIKKHQPPVKGVILDLRNNARGSLDQAVQATSVLLGDQEIVRTKGRMPDTEEVIRGKEREALLPAGLPVVVLADQGTARAAEIMAGALHDQARATLLGSKTLGLCGVTKVLPLQDGSALLMTAAQCYTPKGQKIQGKGLEPEVAGKTPEPTKPEAKTPPKKPTVEQDPWVQQALELLKSGKARQVAQQTQAQ